MPSKKVLDEIVRLTKELVVFRTTNDRVHELHRCLEFIKSYFHGYDVVFREFSFREQPSMIISFNKRKKQGLLINGHIDVVEGFDSQFTPHIEKNLLYGRGTYDMKGSVAAQLVLLRKLANKQQRPPVGMMIVTDEEIGGMDGTKKLVQRGFGGEFCIAGEPTRLQVETRHKGTLIVKIVMYGSSSHGSRPWQGDNALEKLMRRYYKFKDEFELASRKHKWHVSVNPTSCNCESPINVTPSKAEMVIDIRTTEDCTNKRVLSLLEKHGLKNKIIENGSMLYNDRKNKHIKGLKRIAEKHLGRRVKYIKGCGGSDLRFFSEKNMPAVNFGPLGKGHHKHNEYVCIDSLGQYYDILKEFVAANF